MTFRSKVERAKAEAVQTCLEKGGRSRGEKYVGDGTTGKKRGYRDPLTLPLRG